MSVIKFMKGEMECSSATKTTHVATSEAQSGLATVEIARKGTCTMHQRKTKKLRKENLQIIRR